MRESERAKEKVTKRMDWCSSKIQHVYFDSGDGALYEAGVLMNMRMQMHQLGERKHTDLHGFTHT